MGIEGKLSWFGGREVAELVDIVVMDVLCRGLFGAVALAVVSGCAAKLKVVGDEAMMIGENYPGPSSPAVSSSSERSSDEICRRW